MSSFGRGARCLTAAALFVALAMGSATAVASPKAFSIESEEAPRSLLEFGRQSAQQILFVTEKVKGIVTNAVHGNYEPIDALRLLLKGTPLVVSEKSAGVLVVEPQVRGPGASNADPAAVNNEGGATRIAQSTSMVESHTGVANQNSPSSSGSSESERTGLSEIIVTAQKRTERLIDTPVSLSVLTSDSLAKLGAVQLRDFANTVPGMIFTSDGPGFSQISLRGVTTGNLPVSPTVGIYIDDVPIGSTSAFGFGGRYGLDVGLFDIDRIEVLRGPQGTLYGASTMGGLLKYVSKTPDATSFGADVRSGVSDTQDGGISYDGAVSVNAPIMAGAVRATAYYSHDGGYIDNVALGQDNVNRAGIYGGKLDSLFKPTDALTIRIGGFAQDISRDGQANADYSFSGAPLYGRLDQYRLFAEPLDQHFRLASSTIAYDFGPATLTSISSYQTVQTQQLYDFSVAYVPFLAQYYNLYYSAVGLPETTTTNKATEEMRFASNGRTSLQWLIGAFYTHETSRDEEAFDFRNLAGQSVPNTHFTYSEPSLYEEYAVYANLTYHLTSRLELSAGVRRSQDHQAYSQFQTSDLFGNVTIVNSRSTENVSTYLANALYRFSDHANGYLRYATGYRPGGPNFVSYDPVTHLPNNAATFQPDSLKSYEVGYKAETESRSLSADVSVYYIEWNNIQLAASCGASGFACILNAPDGAHVQGSELTLTAQPTSRFTATGTFAYQHAYLESAVPGLGAAEGERLPNVPHYTGTLSGDYEFGEEGLRPALGATIRYISNRTAGYNDGAAVGTPQYDLPAYTLVDLRTSFLINSVNVQLYVHNLFDKLGAISADNNYGATAQLAIVQPRTVGVSGTFHF